MEGFSREYPVNQNVPEQSDLPDEEQALQAFRYLSKTDAAHAALGEFWTNPAITREAFIAALDRFNALTPEERGKGRIEGKSLDERRMRVATATHASMAAYPYEIHQHEDGTITLHFNA